MRAAPRALLVAAALLPPLAARAQTHAPAEDRPGRIVLVPMSVERPAGTGWAMVRRTGSEVVFLHPSGQSRNGRVAASSGKVPDKRARTAAELAENVRDELKQNLDARRFEELAEDVRPDPATDRKCVRYSQRVRDLGAKGPDGKPQTVDLHGLACLHPADEGIVIASTLSERGAAADGGRALAQEAERFFTGVRPHAPLQGKDWQPLAEQGDADAQVWLARLFLLGSKPEKALPWLTRAADQDHPEAQTLLGLAYLTGRAARRDPQEALEWLRLAAGKNYPKAEGLLALAHLNAPEIRSEEEARRWAAKAAADGDPLGQALFGELLVFGRAGVEKKEAEGAAWIRKSAEQGDAGAEYILASLLANGVGVDKDFAQSRFWLELAAAQGHVEARKIVGQARSAARPAEGR